MNYNLVDVIQTIFNDEMPNSHKDVCTALMYIHDVAPFCTENPTYIKCHNCPLYKPSNINNPHLWLNKL